MVNGDLLRTMGKLHGATAPPVVEPGQIQTATTVRIAEMGRNFTDTCRFCFKVFTGTSIARAQNACANHEDICPENPNNVIGQSGPSLEEALENARRELGEW